MTDRVLEALGDKTRRRIVALLADGEAAVSDIVEAFALSQPTVSQHLKVLRSAGVVSVRPHAQQRFYSLNREEIAATAAWMLRMSGYWNARLDALEAQLAATHRKDDTHA